MAVYPTLRLRRLRHNPLVRDMVRETVVRKEDLIYPMFVTHGENIKKEISSMPGVFQFSVENLVKECVELENIGVKAIILFGIPEHKDEQGSEAYAEDGIIQKAIRAIKKELGDKMLVITDVCLCEYTSHGHCGILRDGEIMNDETVSLLAREAVSHAEAGADMIAPSDMMDGRVAVIRKALDYKGFMNIPIMSYAVKYASGYYGPFREAAESTPAFGDRKSHQMDIANAEEAIREAESDIAEGADIIMVKPALAYLDIISRLKQNYHVPLAAYQVSGEYSMMKAAALKGWVDEEKVMVESLTAIKRAGASMILTYYAKEMANYINRNS